MISDFSLQKHTIGVVLAGGQSSRMGQDKALLPFKGETLLHHQVQLLRHVCSRVVVSGEYAGFDCVPDSVMKCGPISGIYSVAKQFPSAALLVVPVDMPQLTEQHLNRLLIPEQSSYIEGHPLPAHFANHNLLISTIQKMLDGTSNDYSIRTLHHLLTSSVLQLIDFDGLNVNYFKQWQEFLQKSKR